MRGGGGGLGGAREEGTSIRRFPFYPTGILPHQLLSRPGRSKKKSGKLEMISQCEMSSGRRLY